MRQGFRNQDPSFHSSGQLHANRVFPVPKRQGLQNFLEMFRAGRFAKQATTELTGIPDSLE